MDNNKEVKKENKDFYKQWWFWTIVVIILIVFFFWFMSIDDKETYEIANKTNSSATNITTNTTNIITNTSNTQASVTTTTNTITSTKNNKPTDLEIMSYTQTVLDNNLNNPKYSRSTKDYTIINTLLRYKVEGEVTVSGNIEKFYMIIEFTDDTYEEYDLVSLQVGNKNIY